MILSKKIKDLMKAVWAYFLKKIISDLFKLNNNFLEN